MKDLRTRFFGHTVRAASGCLETTYSSGAHGYGQIKDGQQNKMTHRVAWELAHGSIPDGMLVCHTCDNKRCVDVDHLWLGTTADNMHDRDRKGRHARQKGQDASGAKLTTEQVFEIKKLRAASGLTLAEIGARYGVLASAVCRICNGTRWPHLTGNTP